MTSVVINECFGGFGLSRAAEIRLAELGCPGKSYDVQRDDPRLVQVVREMGKKADGGYAELAVVEVPDDADWYVHEYDGLETVYEKHRAWDSNGERVMGA